MLKLLGVHIGPFNLSSVRKGGALTHFSPKRNRFTRAPLIDRLLADSIMPGYGPITALREQGAATINGKKMVASGDYRSAWVTVN